MESGKIIVVANQKGGVAKTSTVRNLSYALAEMGKKVLVVDFDPQYNLTTSFGVLPTQAPYNTGTLITNLLLDESLPDTNEFIQKIGSVDLIPSSRSLTVAEANLLMTPDSNDYLAMELCGHHPPEAEAILNSALEKIDRIAFAKVQTITCHGKDDYSLWSAEIPKDMLHSILHEACERVGTLDELMDAMNPKDGYEMRLFIQTPGRQFAFYRIPERLSNLEDYANEGCSVRGTKDEIMAEIFTEWAPAQEDLEDDFEL